MPIRPRRRQHRLHLAVREYVDLAIGPAEDSPIPFDRYHALYHEHREKFASDAWAFRYFEGGTDDREPMELDLDEPNGCPGT